MTTAWLRFDVQTQKLSIFVFIFACNVERENKLKAVKAGKRQLTLYGRARLRAGMHGLFLIRLLFGTKSEHKS
jgi:hypothetical protein